MGKVIGLTIKEDLKFVCPMCGKEYKTEDGLNKHIKEKHNENP